MTRNTFVAQIEWRCQGQCGDRPKSSKAKKKYPGTTEHLLLRYVKEQGPATVFKNKDRLRMDKEMFGLKFDPVSSHDRGRYKCLVNNRPAPDAVIKMKVLGKCV